MRSQRRRDLLRILHEGQATSQKAIIDKLGALGHEVTQATVSRDLRELGATKVRIDGRTVYALPDDIPRGAGGDLMARNLDRTLSEFALDIRQAASIVVVQTAPGHASAVARAIDMTPAKELVGTVAGDDTIFVATPSEQDAARLTEKWLGVARGTEVAS
jgi:transcriptional regulator of arginine metabolism